MGADSSSRAPWESILNNNLIGTYNVYEAARLEGVRRVVFASSNWACAFHIAQHGKVGPADMPVRPSTLYGVSKCFGEALGSHYCDTYGLSVICLRIGRCHDASDEGPNAAMVCSWPALIINQPFMICLRPNVCWAINPCTVSSSSGTLRRAVPGYSIIRSQYLLINKNTEQTRSGNGRNDER